MRRDGDGHFPSRSGAGFDVAHTWDGGCDAMLGAYLGVVRGSRSLELGLLRDRTDVERLACPLGSDLPSLSVTIFTV